ncbi:helix-turn-helix transcriptional regulator [Bacteriovoracaceae bacterium]|nr:helix-turn-helix transcriptional regulator [Bacteriovoracaceae bacterium]
MSKKLCKLIGKKIKEDIKTGRLGIDTIEKLSFEADVARSTIRELMNGNSDPRVGTLLKIVKALGYIDLKEFLSSI